MKKKRTLLVGIDAACWEYLDPLLAQGRLPTFKQLMDSGVHGTLDSVMPPMTPVAWSSVATGKNPAKHGVYEWVRRKHDGYEFSPLAVNDRAGTPFWRRLGESGIRVGLVNVPLTYPPTSVDGFIVCGFGVPDSAQNFTYPSELRDMIEKNFGAFQAVVPTSLKNESDSMDLFEAERLLQKQQVEIAVYAAEQYDVDVLVINLMFLDHANHYFKSMAQVENAISETDSHLKILIEGFQPDNTLLISDHGSRRVNGRFLLGSWLYDHGYLAWPDSGTQTRDYINWLLAKVFEGKFGGVKVFERIIRRVILESWVRSPSSVSNLYWNALRNWLPLQNQKYWSAPRTDTRLTKVYYGSSWGCIYMNISDREPTGVIPQEEIEEIQSTLVEELSDITDPDTGAPLFSGIYNRAQLYITNPIGQPPDLVLDYYSSSWTLSMQVPPPFIKKDGYFIREDDHWWSGEHSSEGVFIFSGQDISQNPQRGSGWIIDIPTTLLYLCEVPIPDDYDGEVLKQFLEPSLISERPPSSQSGDTSEVSYKNSGYSDDEANEILDHLRNLGYLE